MLYVTVTWGLMNFESNDQIELNFYLIWFMATYISNNLQSIISFLTVVSHPGHFCSEVYESCFCHFFLKAPSVYDLTSKAGVTEHWTFAFNVRMFVHVRRTFEHANMGLRKKLKNIRTLNMRTFDLSNNRILANIRTLNIRTFEYERTSEH